jgi:hypothetical protein
VCAKHLQLLALGLLQRVKVALEVAQGSLFRLNPAQLQTNQSTLDI